MVETPWKRMRMPKDLVSMSIPNSSTSRMDRSDTNTAVDNNKKRQSTTSQFPACQFPTVPPAGWTAATQTPLWTTTRSVSQLPVNSQHVNSQQFHQQDGPQRHKHRCGQQQEASVNYQSIPSMSIPNSSTSRMDRSDTNTAVDNNKKRQSTTSPQHW